VTLAEHPFGVDSGAKLEEKERFHLFPSCEDEIHQSNIDCKFALSKARGLSALALSGIR
jgi:hypothetical protein